MTGDKAERFPWKPLGSGLLLYLVIQAFFIGIASVAGSSEAREMQAADIIRRENNWILPLRNGLIPSKPPLYHWLVAAVSTILGEVTEFSARFASQLSAALVILSVAFVSYRLSDLSRTFQTAKHPSRVALLAGAITSLTYGFYQMGCQAMVDMTFTACVWLAWAGASLGIKADTSGVTTGNRRGSSIFWFFAFLAILARGPIGVILPVALAMLAGLVTVGVKQTSKIFLRPSLGWLAVGFPILWYLWAYQVGGEAFLNRQIYFENFKRFAGGDFVNTEVWWFYGPSILRTAFPWSVVWISMVFAGLFSPRTLSYGSSRRIVRWLPSILLFFGVILFSASAGKRHSYLLPLLPLIAIQIALEFSNFFEQGGAVFRKRLLNSAGIIERFLLFILAVLIFGVTFVAESGILRSVNFRATYFSLLPLLARLGPIVLTLGLVALVGVRRNLKSLMASVWVTSIVTLTSIVAAGAVIKSNFKGFDAIAITWLATVGESEELAVFKHPFDEYFDPLLFYVRRPVRLIALDRIGEECREGTVYAAKRGWLEAHQHLFSGEIVRIVIAQERLLASRGDNQRDLVFFRCGLRGSWNL